MRDYSLTITDHPPKSLIVHIFAQQSQLPAFMLGEFQLDTSEGFSDFMYQVGVNWFTRTVK